MPRRKDGIILPPRAPGMASIWEIYADLEAKNLTPWVLGTTAWLRLGIRIERIQPGHPQQNGRHERMHLTLKREPTRPAGENVLQQQAKFDAFLAEFNNERPHQALAMKLR